MKEHEQKINSKEKSIKNKFRAIIFDFDYTLADTSRGATECINFSLNSLGLPIASYEAICKTIGMSLSKTFRTLSGQKNRTQTDNFIRNFKKRADEIMEELSFIYDSVPIVARRLKQNGLSLGIVSTKFRYRIESILKRENLLDLFDIIIGGEDVSKPKPDPMGLRIAIDRLGISPIRTLYVGDSVIDAQTAQRGDIPFAATLSGITKKSEFDKYPSYKVADNLHILTDWLLN